MDGVSEGLRLLIALSSRQGKCCSRRLESKEDAHVLYDDKGVGVN